MAGVVELELLQAVEGGGSEPAVQGGRIGHVPVVEAVLGDREAAGGARVRGEDARDIAGGDAAVAVRSEAEVERRGAP